MATYPDDATISQESFSVASSKTFSSTGATTVFALDSAATFVGEIIAIADGIRQAVKRESFPTKGDQKNMASTEKNTINIVDKANPPNAKILFSGTIAREVDGSELISIYIKCCRPDISG